MAIGHAIYQFGTNYQKRGGAAIFGHLWRQKEGLELWKSNGKLHVVTERVYGGESGTYFSEGKRLTMGTQGEFACIRMVFAKGIGSGEIVFFAKV